MQTTIATPTTTEMPVVDSPLDPEVADALGNDLLLGTAADNRVARVAGTGRSAWINTSGESRAWTSAGNVD